MLGGNIVVLDKGRVLQTGDTTGVYQHPETLRVGGSLQRSAHQCPRHRGQRRPGRHGRRHPGSLGRTSLPAWPRAATGSPFAPTTCGWRLARSMSPLAARWNWPKSTARKPSSTPTTAERLCRPGGWGPSVFHGQRDHRVHPPATTFLSMTPKVAWWPLRRLPEPFRPRDQRRPHGAHPFDHIAHSYFPKPKGPATTHSKRSIPSGRMAAPMRCSAPPAAARPPCSTSFPGCIKPSRGRVLYDGVDVTALPPEKRNIAQVFQFPVLYDTMSVFDNLAFPLKNRGVNKADIAKRVRGGGRNSRPDAGAQDKRRRG